MDLLVELLVALIAYLFRKLTKTPGDDADGDAETAIPGSAAGTPYSSRSSPPQRHLAQGMLDTSPLRHEAETLNAVALELSRTAERERNDALSAVIDGELMAPLGRYLETMPEAVDHAVYQRAMRQLQHIASHLELLHTLLAPRADPDWEDTLTVADRVVADLYDPALAFADAQELGLLSRVPLVSPQQTADQLSARLRLSAVAPIPLPRAFSGDMHAWTELAHAIGRDVFHSVPGLEDEIRLRLQLTAGPQPDVRLSAQQALYRVLGTWLEDLFAHAVGTLIMGPAYGESLLTRQAAQAAPAEGNGTPIQRVGSGQLLPSLAWGLRVRVAAAVLHHLGQHQAADDLLSRASKLPGWGARLRLPMRNTSFGSGSGYAEMRHEDVHPPIQTVIEALLEGRFDALGRFRLMEIPGFAYLHGEHAHVLRLIPAIKRGAVPHEAPRFIVGAAILAIAKDPTIEPRVLRHVWGSLGRQVDSRRPPGAAEANYAQLPWDAALRFACRDRQTLRDALLVGMALAPPPKGNISRY